MGQVTLTIAGRSHNIACRDGEELHLERLGALLERHADTAVRASGGLSGERTMLFLALILADQLDEAERNPPGGVSPVLLENLADRLEAVALALEEPAPNA
ncbi:MAG: cell division protein ZapA [Sphingomonas sp. 32-66-10]|nr:MAG: cell division protein ZapA [Sphingomonas sp. 32-66-10]